MSPPENTQRYVVRQTLAHFGDEEAKRSVQEERQRAARERSEAENAAPSDALRTLMTDALREETTDPKAAHTRVVEALGGDNELANEFWHLLKLRAKLGLRGVMPDGKRYGDTTMREREFYATVMRVLLLEQEQSLRDRKALVEEFGR